VSQVKEFKLNLDFGYMDYEDVVAEVKELTKTFVMNHVHTDVHEHEYGTYNVDFYSKYRWDLEKVAHRFLGGRAGYGDMAQHLVRENAVLVDGHCECKCQSALCTFCANEMLKTL
jgi:hypothetical protein